MRDPLPPAIDAEEWTPSLPSSEVFSYRDLRGSGPPVILLHSMNAAPSAAEVQPIFAALRGRRPVLAVDLPGFGRSPRIDRPYTPAFFATVIREFLSACGGAPAHLLALSTTGEFAARVATEVPAQVASLTVVSPTGLGKRNPPGEATSARVHRVLRAPLLGSALFRVLRTRPSVRFFLAQSFHGSPSEYLLDYACQTAAQPGASYAPFYFLSGKMFDADALHNLYLHVGVPALVLYDRDPHTGFEKLDALLEHSGNWRAERIEGSCGLPQFDQPEHTLRALEKFWLEVEA